MASQREEPERKPRDRAVLPVETIVVTPESSRFVVASQGTVEPRTQTTLVSRVSGRIEEVAPIFSPGGVFAPGEPLLRIEESDYRAALARAEAVLAARELELAQEEARVEQARRDWERMGEGTPSALTLREPQLRQAEAQVAAAAADVEKARRDLDRTVITAPYVGMVRARMADLGQYVTPGTPLGEVFAVDEVEIRLPVSSREMQLLGLGERRPGQGSERLTTAELRVDFGGAVSTWEAEIVRTEGTIDATNRMLYLVARVADPYGVINQDGRPPLKVGQFVTAAIEGPPFEDLFVLPRHVVRGEGTVLIVDDESRLHEREVEVFRRLGNLVYISGGLKAGERVCLTNLDYIVEGMEVNDMARPEEPKADESSEKAVAQRENGDKDVS